VRIACKAFKAEGAKKAVPLSISGSFHSPFMEEAGIELGELIKSTRFNMPLCPVVQCVDGEPHTDPNKIQENLVKHITNSVQWTKMVNNMQAFGVGDYYEAGPDDTLQKIVTRMCPESKVLALADIPTYQHLIINFKTT